MIKRLTSGTPLKTSVCPYFNALFIGINEIKSGCLEPMQKNRAYAISKWSWWERQAVTTTGLTLDQTVGVVIHSIIRNS